jgi:hypothetical protein
VTTQGYEHPVWAGASIKGGGVEKHYIPNTPMQADCGPAAKRVLPVGMRPSNGTTN